MVCDFWGMEEGGGVGSKRTIKSQDEQESESCDAFDAVIMELQR